MSDTDTLNTRRAARGEKSGRRIESLLAIAKEVFAEKGFERTTTAEIAQRLGVSEATVFTYFGSKRELCLQVIRRWYDQISGELERELPPLNGLRAKLAFVVRKHLVNLMGEGAGLCALVLSEGRTADAAFGSVIADLKRRYTAPLMHALGAAREAGELREGVPLRLLRDMVYGAMEHVLWDYVVSGKKPDIEQTAAQLTDMLWSAFMPADASLDALSQFRAEVGDALRRLDAPAAFRKPTSNPESA
ncbi:TetR/AcrR family transcriptional regulator [Variovorax sp. J22G73]|jgi:AcrR family transcriptional regulator|uniref:TetR/AcrR family transcriptional regulator n=1 Tax=unclassified Variovorax TaxID=663243 RepID=UPI0025791705|nr:MULTISPECIES: TetR/AcrR family transcriptional regulator [unclassified Variovorax]MDM0003836.1 TetR/AcrR family transcriptional regulator [Variovorax sp. J22R203]MDM0096498.1 TetR/AcrR family transcriptional regulator [Variovorax sp. J22G73]